MDGVTAIRTLRESGNQIPVIALTASVLQQHRDQCESVGCNDFASKPIDRKLLENLLRKWL